jgi:predicted neuraminidase
MQSTVLYEIERRPGLCHCSSLAENDAGELIGVWYEGSYEGAPDTVIRASFKKPGSSWQRAEDLFHFPGVPLGNPVLFSLDRRNLYILFSILLGESWTESVLYLSRSSDGGHRWSNPELLFPRKGLMAKTRPLILDSGRILMPLYNEVEFYPVVLVVEDPTQWAQARFTAETMARGSAIQPVLAPLGDGTILMLCRTTKGTIWKSLSSNGGLSWSICTPTRLPNPNSALDLLVVEPGSLVLAFNNSAGDRSSLSVALSRDAGSSWAFLRDVDSGEGEYSYPCLLRDRTGRMHLSYTENRCRIRHIEFDLPWLTEHPLEEPLRTD